MTFQFLYLRRAPEKPRPAGYGLMFVMIGLPVARNRRLFGSRTPRIGKRNIRTDTWPDSEERYKPMRFLDSIDCTNRAALLRQRVGRMFGASSMTCLRRMRRQSPR